MLAVREVVVSGTCKTITTPGFWGTSTLVVAVALMSEVTACANLL